MENFPRIWICLVLCGLLFNQGKGQNVNNTLSLPYVLQKTELNSPSLLADSTLIQIRLSQAKEIANNRLPNLNIGYQVDLGTNNNVAGPYFSFGLVPSNTSGVRSYSTTSLAGVSLGVAALNWEFYNFGLYASQNRVAQSNIQVEQNNFYQSKYYIKALVLDDYLQLTRIEDYLKILLVNIRRSEEIKRSIMALTKSGIRPGVDTSIAEAELSKTRLNFIELENQKKQVQIHLSKFCGIPSDSLRVDTSLENKSISRFANQADSISIFSQNPRLLFYQSLYENSLLQEKLIKNLYNPKLFLEGAAWTRGSSVHSDGSFGNIGSGFNPIRNNYVIGLGISYNLLDFRRTRLKLETQRYFSEFNKKKLQEQSEFLQAELEQATSELHTANLRLKEIPQQLRAAHSGYRQNLSLYKNGLSDIIVLSTSQEILLRAETDYIQAKYLFTKALFQKAILENQVSTYLQTLKY